MGCGAANGEMDEGKRLVKEVLDQHLDQGSTTDGDHDETELSDAHHGQSVEASAESEAVSVQNESEEAPGETDEPTTTKAKSKSKSRGKK